MARQDYQPTPQQQYPDLERMVQQRRLGYLDQQALLRSLNQQRMLQGQQPARSLEEAVAAPPGKVRQTEVAPLQIDPRLFAGRGSSSAESSAPQDSGYGSALASLDFGGMRKLFQQQPVVPLPRPRPAGAPGPQPASGAVPHLQPGEQQQIPRTGVAEAPASAGGAYPRGANYMTGQPGQSIISVKTAAGNINAHSSAAPALQGFVNDLHAAGAPITSIGSYNMRRIAGSERWSQHAYGNAIDINQSARNRVSSDFQRWANDHPDALRAAQAKWNIRSGGDWNNPDFGHFEWAGKPVAQTPTAPASAAPAAPARGASQQGGTRATWFHTGAPYQAKPEGATWADPAGQREGLPASGLGHNVPGIATPGRQGLGEWHEVTLPDGRRAVLQKTDVGPGSAAQSRGVGVDINAAAAAQLYPGGPQTFPSGSQGWSVRRLGKDLPAGMQPGVQGAPAAAAPAAQSPQQPAAVPAPAAPAAPVVPPAAAAPAPAPAVVPAPAPAPVVAPRALAPPPPPSKTGSLGAFGVRAEHYGGDLNKLNAYLRQSVGVLAPSFSPEKGGPQQPGAHFILPPEAGGGTIVIPGATKPQLYEWHTKASKYLPGLKLKDWEQAPQKGSQAPQDRRGALPDDPAGARIAQLAKSPEAQAYAADEVAARGRGKGTVPLPPQRPPEAPALTPQQLLEESRSPAQRAQPLSDELNQREKYGDPYYRPEGQYREMPEAPGYREFGDEWGQAKPYSMGRPPLDDPREAGRPLPGVDQYRQYGGGRHGIFGLEPAPQRPETGPPQAPPRLSEGLAKAVLAATQAPGSASSMPSPEPTPQYGGFQPAQPPPPQPVQTTWEPPAPQAQPFGQGNMSPIPWEWMQPWGWGGGPAAFPAPTWSEGFAAGGGGGLNLGEGFAGFNFGGE